MRRSVDIFTYPSKYTDNYSTNRLFLHKNAEDMGELTSFVLQHLTDDTARLILDKARWPGVDMDLAVNCIESRRKLKGKVQEWYDEPELIFPLKLSAEQCSSSGTARYKAQLACRIAGKGMKIADLTGGFGVDSWFFSKVADEVLYNEMLPALADAARHNFSILGAGNIHVSNRTVSTEDSISDILDGFAPDIVYMDPARRGEGGRKVFLIEDCQPDVLGLKDGILQLSRHMLIKLSPMADITMVADRLGSHCREIHIIGAGGECKELLVWMDREWNGEYSVITSEIHADSTEYQTFKFKPSEERSCSPAILQIPSDAAGWWLFEPGKALMKSGAFSTVSERFSIGKLGRSTHYYMTASPEKAEELKAYGKVFRIIRSCPLDKRTMKAAGKEFPKAEVTARNIPMDTDTLRKKLGTASGDRIHIFGLRSDISGNILLVTER